MAFLASSPSPLHSAASMLLHGTAGGAPAATARLSVLGSGTTPRRAVVMVVAVPGEGTAPLARRRCYAYAGDQWSPAGNYEAFDRQMKQFRKTYEATALLKEHDEELEATSITAKKCLSLLEMIVQDSASEYYEEEVFRIGESFVEVEMQCGEGYARVKSIVDAMDSLKRMVEIFAVAGGDTRGLTRYPGPSQFANTNAYLEELVNHFQTLSNEVETRYMQDRPW